MNRLCMRIALGAVPLLCCASVSSGGDLPLIDAVKRQDAPAVRSLIAKGVDVNQPQPDGATALH